MILLCIVLITIQHSVCMNEINDTTLTTSTVLSESDYSTVYEDVTTTETTTQEENFENAFKFNVINQSVTTDEIELNENSIGTVIVISVIFKLNLMY